MTIMRRLLGLALTSVLLTPAAAAPPAEGPPAGKRPALPYTLADIAGLDQYTGPKAGLALLRQRGLVVTPEEKKHIFGFYESGKLPSMVTLDTAIYAYQVIFVECFAKFERRQAKVLAKLQDQMWEVLAAGELVDEKKVTFPAQPRAGAATMVLTARRLLEPDWRPKTPRGQELAKSVAKAVEAELGRIKAATLAKSPLFARVVDYSQFTPRSFYAGNAELERYFRARTFWGQAMNLKDDAALKTATMLAIIHNSVDGRWAFQETYREFVGPPAIIGADGLAVLLNTHVWIGDKDLGRLALEVLNGKRLAQARKELRTIHLPYLPTGATAEQVGDAHSGDALLAALFPKAAMPDTQIMARQIHPVVPGRALPGGLDVLASLGNRRAESLLLASVGPGTREALAAAIQANKARLKRAAEAQGGGSGLFGGATVDVVPDPLPWQHWRAVFESLGDPGLGKQHPRFMDTDAYADKSVNTALCGWVGYRHAFQLHAEELGGLFSSLPEVPPGYVEPNLRAWDAMIDMTLGLQEWLGEYDVPSGSLGGLTKMCLTARRNAAKQLAGEKLTKRENEWLQDFGMMLAGLCGHSSNLLHIGDDDGIIADIAAARDTQEVLYVATARPRAMYAVFDYGGRLQLARGGVLHYREFTRPLADGRLTDQRWREMLKAGKAPPPPAWLAAVGAAYEKKSILAALKAGRVSPSGVVAVADKEVLMAAIEAAKTTAPTRIRPFSGDGPVAPDRAVWELSFSRKELFDAEAVLALAAVAETQQRTSGSSDALIAVLDCLPPKPSLVKTYIALAERWASKERTRKLGEEMVTPIIRCRAAEGSVWLARQIIEAPGSYRLCAERELFRLQPHLMSLRLKRHFTKQAETALAKWMGLDRKKRPTREELREIAEHLARLGGMWPARPPDENGYGPAGTGRVAYTDQQQPSRATAVRAARAVIDVVVGEVADWDQVLVGRKVLVGYARLLGPEVLSTRLGPAIREDYPAMRWVTSTGE